MRVCVGIDFGTTNSLITYALVDTRDTLSIFQTAESITPGVTPSAYNKENGMLGWRALRRFLKPEDVERYFKIDLPGARDGRGYVAVGHPAYRTTRDYLRQLFERFQQEYSDLEIEQIAFSVPEAWISGDEQAGGRIIRKIAEDLGLNAPIVISEPVAAAAYYAWLTSQSPNQPYNGHVLVYDHGGGTLDLSLVKIEGQYVERVRGFGISTRRRGEAIQSGCGGVAYDWRVFEHLSLEAGNGLRRLNSSERMKWLNEFEQCKSGNGLHLAPLIDQYLGSGKDDYAFTVTLEAPAIETVVRISDLVDPFNEHIAPKISEALDSFMIACKLDRPHLLDDPERFQVLLVGGFSEFRAIQHLLEGYFSGANYSTRSLKANDIMPRSDKWLGISKGACLVAGSRILNIQNCPYTFGIVSYTGMERHHNDLMVRGDPVDQYRRSLPRVLRQRLGAGDLANPNSAVEFYREVNGVREPMFSRGTLRHELPNYSEDNHWSVGAFIENGEISIEFTDKNDVRRIMRIHRFFDHLT